MGFVSGFIILLLLDLFALDDITTDGAWMPEILIILCSIPALLTLGYLTLKRPTLHPRLEGQPDNGAFSHPALPDPGKPAHRN